MPNEGQTPPYRWRKRTRFEKAKRFLGQEWHKHESYGPKLLAIKRVRGTKVPTADGRRKNSYGGCATYADLFWSHAVLDAADRGNYLATAKEGILQSSPHSKIKQHCPNYSISSPESFLPWEKIGRAVSAEKFKKKIEDGENKACYLRKIGTDNYQIWMPETNKITTVRMVDFIIQRPHTSTPDST